MKKLSKKILSVAIIVCMLVGTSTVSNATASRMSGNTSVKASNGGPYYINVCTTSGTKTCRIEATRINQSSGGINFYNEVSSGSICIISTTMHTTGSYRADYSFKTSQTLTYFVGNLTANSVCDADLSWNYNY